MNTVEKIIRKPFKDAYPLEDDDFTPWICENIDVAGEAVGLEIVNPQREQSTRNF